MNDVLLKAAAAWAVVATMLWFAMPDRMPVRGLANPDAVVLMRQLGLAGFFGYGCSGVASYRGAASGYAELFAVAGVVLALGAQQGWAGALLHGIWGVVTQAVPG